MKFGAHIYLWENRWSDQSLPLIDRAKHLGLDFLEIAWGDDVSLTPKRTAERARDAGLELVLSPGALWPMNCDISLENTADQRRGLDWHKRAIDVAAELDAVAYTGAIYGHPGHVEPHKPTDDELHRVAGNLHQLAAHAAARSLPVVLEPMSHFRTHLVNRPDQLMRLIAMAQHPNLLALLDTYHMVPEVRDYPGAFRTAAPKLWGIHASENDRGVPGKGLIPWKEIACVLRQTGFDGYVGLESYNSLLAPTRSLFHDPCPDGDAFVREGLDFLRTLLN